MNDANIIYEIENDAIISISEAGVISYISPGTTKVNVKGDFFEDTYFYVHASSKFEFFDKANYNRSILKNRTNETLFIGDSFFEYWKNGNNSVVSFYEEFENYHVTNLGISATTTHDWRVM